MRLDKHKEVKLLEVSKMERAKKGKIYPKGCTCVQVSATRGQTVYLNESREVESSYVVFEPNENKIDGRYMYYMIEREMPRFCQVYQTGLNIQVGEFNFLKIRMHTEMETQKHIAEMLSYIEDVANYEQQTTNDLKEIKKWGLKKMMV